MVFDVASALMLVCLALVLRATAAGERPRGWRRAGLAAAVVGVAVVRAGGDAALTLDVASAALLAGVVLTAGHDLVARRTWPPGAFVVAVAVVTAAGAYLRAYELSETISPAQPEQREPLQPDVRYYQQQALQTANPFAAGLKSPLWPALHAPLVRGLADRDLAMRVLSWSFGILMIPAVALGIGRLFEPLVGVVVAGLLATDSFLIDLCTKGLREELGVCLWMVVLVLLFERRGGFSWRRAVGAGLAAGLLLLLRNTDAPVLLLLVAYALVRTRTKWPRALVGGLLPIAVVAPFYVNQWRVYGDAFYLEKRDARYHANMEFIGGRAPPGLSMPARAEFDRDPYAGEPLSPAAYLFKYHSPGRLAASQWEGLKRVLGGEPFSAGFSWWTRLACAAGVLATLLTAETRFAGLFVLGSVLGIRAHLIVVGGFEERLLLPVLVLWLAGGCRLIASAVRAGGRRWLAFSRPIPTKTP